MTRRIARLLAITLIGTACSDALEQNTTVGQVIAVATNDGSALTLVAANDFTTSSVLLAGFLGMDSRIAGRASTLLVTSASSGVITVVDLTRRPYAATPGPAPLATPSGSVIQDDSIAWVVFPSQLGRLNYRTGELQTVAVGRVNTDVVFTAGSVFVLSGNRTGVLPLPPSYVSVVDPTSMTVQDSIPLSGTGATHMTVGDDSLIYIVDSGLLSDSAGRLSIVDPMARAEIVLVNGLGPAAGQAVFHPSGRLLIASALKGIIEVNTLTRTLTRGPATAIVTGGLGITGLAIDEAGRIYAMDSNTCAVNVLAPPPNYRLLQTPAVGGCGYSAATATLP